MPRMRPGREAGPAAVGAPSSDGALPAQPPARPRPWPTARWARTVLRESPPPVARMLSGLSEGGSSGLWVPGWQLLPWKPVFPA